MTDLLSTSRGRPLIEFDWNLLDKTLSRGGKMADCVYFLGVSASTIERRIRDDMGMTFSDYRELQLTGLRMKILDTQADVAIKDRDSAMLIHLGKQLCGQSDKTQNLNVGVSIEEYLRQLQNPGGVDGQD